MAYEGIKINIKHTGFCLGEYDNDKCQDCPTLAECLKLYISDLPADHCDINPRIPCTLDCPWIQKALLI